MAKQPRQGGRPIERRNGQEGFSWEGIATKVDPAGNPPNRPRDLVNVRVQGGDIISRPSFQAEGGFIPLMPEYDLTTPDAGERPAFNVAAVARQVPHWLADHASAAGVRLWFMFGEPSTAFAFTYLCYLDTDADRPVQVVAAFRNGTFTGPLPIEKFNNEIYVGDHGGLRKVYLVPSREGEDTPPIELDKITDDVIVSVEPGGVVALQEHDGLLFFVVYTAAASPGEIYSWDGLTVRLEFTMASFFSSAIAAVYKDTLVVAVADYGGVGLGALLVRDAAGAWTTHTIPGFLPTRVPNGVAEYGNLLYIMGGNLPYNEVFTWDGTTIVLAYTLPATGSEMHVCARLAGRLYCAYSYVSGPTSRTELLVIDQDNDLANRFNPIGTRNGVFSEGTGIAPVWAMAAYRGRLWLFQPDDADGTERLMWHSQQFVPYDGWQNHRHAHSFTEGADGFEALVSTVAGCFNMRTL